MEDLGDIKVFRKNLMIISIIDILVFIFAGEIKEINILGLIKLENIESYKILILLLITNIYALFRYKQYLFKYNLDINKKIFIIDIINNTYFKNNIIKLYKKRAHIIKNNIHGYKHHKAYNKEEIIDIYFNNSLSVFYSFKEGKETNKGCLNFCYDGITKKEITGGFYSILENNNLGIYLHNTDYKNNHEDDNISIEYKNNKLVFFYLKLIFYIKEHAFSDYYLPIILGIIGIELLIIKITYLILS